MYNKQVCAILFHIMLTTLFTTQSEGGAMNNASEINTCNQALAKEAELQPLALEIDRIQKLLQTLTSKESNKEKIAYLHSLDIVQEYLSQEPDMQNAFRGYSEDTKYVLLQILALGQGPYLFSDWKGASDSKREKFFNIVLSCEQFYSYMGAGIVGYHLATLQRIYDQLLKNVAIDDTLIEKVPFVDIRNESDEVSRYIGQALTHFPSMAEVYVVGGAGDRLNLKDPKTNIALPVACLEFAGRSLLSGLFRDLEAREYLYYKLTKNELFTPVVLMTSHEKDNNAHIEKICKRQKNFGRPQESLFVIIQPLTPVIASDGNWAVHGPMDLISKPGGHGVIWKLAKDSGCFEWLEKQNRHNLIVRQINNPIAGLDYGLLALYGYGTSNNKAFGFESCPRKENMTEGMNVLRKRLLDDNTAEVCISNIEYTEFAKRKEKTPGFAEKTNNGDFPTNTNILFANTKALQEAMKKSAVCGLIVNMKQPVQTMRPNHAEKVTLPGARLESTMQNIADVMTNRVELPLSDEKLKALDTFVLVNDRSKTISVTKKAFDGKDIIETPEGCFYDLMQENLSLLKNVCRFSVPDPVSMQEYAQTGPQALFIYHPALGPLYSIIGQKIQRGSLAKNSELQIEAQEVFIRDLHVDGSLCIMAENVCGSIDEKSQIRSFDGNVGSIHFENVRVHNKGIDQNAKNEFWSLQISRLETCEIVLEGNSEIYAKDVELLGNHKIVVPNNTRCVLSQNADGTLDMRFETLTFPLRYQYAQDQNGHVTISRLN